MNHDVGVHVDAPLPDGFIDAFWRYDVALLANDVTELDALFECSDHVLRADASGVLKGYAAISEFRAVRHDRPTRRVSRLWARVLSDDLVYCTAEVRSTTGSAGLQTQLWRRSDNAWRISAAHVTPPSKPIENTVWRVAGAPLIAGTPGGPLTGQTISVKDLFAVAGVARSAGVKAYLAEQIPQSESASAVRQLLAAGASVTGVSHTDQFAFSLAGRNVDWGTPTNLAAPCRVPGGSSSGSATAVRNGWSTVGLGTDTAGSVRVPSSYQGLWGFRPTHGAVSMDGVCSLAPSFDTVGWITREASTLRAVGDVLLPADEVQPPVRAVWSADIVAVADNPGVRDAVERMARALDAEELPALPDLTAWTAAFRTIQAREAWEQHGHWIATHPGALEGDIAARFAAGRDVTDDELSLAWETLRAARATMTEVLCDCFLVLPTVGSPAPLLNATPAEVNAHRWAALRLTTLASLTGFPAVSMPLISHENAPVGLSVVTSAGTDRALLELAGAPVWSEFLAPTE